MGDLGNLIDENDDVFLKVFIDDCEVMDIGEAYDSYCLLTRHHRVHIAARRDVLGDDTRAGIAEAQRQQMANLLNGLLQDGRLHVLINLFAFLLLLTSHESEYTGILHFILRGCT